MEKSLIVQQLELPQDALDHICSFIFYSIIESTKRKREMYSIVMRECKRVRKEELVAWGNNVLRINTVYYVLPRGNQLIFACICCNCGNYVKPSYYPSKNIVCKCVF